MIVTSLQLLLRLPTITPKLSFKSLERTDGTMKNRNKVNSTTNSNNETFRDASRKTPHDNSNNDPHDSPRKANDPPVVRPIVITLDAPTSCSATEAAFSIVDPWVPRIQNNDEYLERGLDFSRRVPNNDQIIRRKEKNYGTRDKQHEIAPPMGNIGAIRLGHALSFNTHLIDLNLSGNDIGSEGAVALAKALYSSSIDVTASAAATDDDGNVDSPDKITRHSSRTALKRLDLSNNHAADEGAMAFAMALRYNQSLVKLNLSFNGISHNGVIGLLKGLESNACLKILNLVDNLDSVNVDRGDSKRTKVENANMISKVVNSLGNVLQRGCNQRNGSVLEILELHSQSSGWRGDPDDGDVANEMRNHYNAIVSEKDAWHLVQAMYGIKDRTNTSSDTSLKKSTFFLPQGAKLRNHRIRILTLPNKKVNHINYNNKHSASEVFSKKRKSNGQKRNIIPSQHLQKLLQFNTLYHPIMELHDILLNNPPQQSQLQQPPQAPALSLHQKQSSIKLPYHLQREASSGALIGLLPSSFSNSNPTICFISLQSSPSLSFPPMSSSSFSSGVEFKLMPHLLSFTAKECTLVTLWNVIRYRPDIFRYAGRRMRWEIVECSDLVCSIL